MFSTSFAATLITSNKVGRMYSCVAAAGEAAKRNWDNSAEALDDDRFCSSMKVTMFNLVLALPLQIALGFGSTFLIKAKWKARGMVRALFLIPMVVAGGIWRMILGPLWGIVNWGLGPMDWFGDANLAMVSIIIIDTWRWTSFVVLNATAALLVLPCDIFEVAAIDGANWGVMLWPITLLLLVPIIAATFVVRWRGGR